MCVCVCVCAYPLPLLNFLRRRTFGNMGKFSWYIIGFHYHSWRPQTLWPWLKRPGMCSARREQLGILSSPWTAALCKAKWTRLLLLEEEGINTTARHCQAEQLETLPMTLFRRWGKASDLTPTLTSNLYKFITTGGRSPKENL